MILDSFSCVSVNISRNFNNTNLSPARLIDVMYHLLITGYIYLYYIWWACRYEWIAVLILRPSSSSSRRDVGLLFVCRKFVYLCEVGFSLRCKVHCFDHFQENSNYIVFWHNSIHPTLSSQCTYTYSVLFEDNSSETANTANHMFPPTYGKLLYDRSSHKLHNAEIRTYLKSLMYA